ncbi:hypothetical protein [Corynebacterium riegelii]|uniref:Holin n=1 Tax=Corynebacterium riegelii TaxID=156976 RepID=A0A0K1RBT9_9CORY|nr:hypothetical protein [Corynebacterium riegelii]AKV58858.1 hypothetical protein AK829_06395 [Corynebacterium riegelii]
MGEHALTRAAEHVIASEPWWRRYKGSIIIVLTGVVAVLAQLAESTDWQNTTTGTVLTVLATAVGFVVNRFTRDAMTPSMTPRLEQAARGGGYAD